MRSPNKMIGRVLPLAVTLAILLCVGIGLFFLTTRLEPPSNLVLSFAGLFAVLVGYAIAQPSVSNRLRPGRMAVENVVDGLPAAVLMLDEDGKIVHANPAALVLTGWTSGDVIGCELDGLLATATNENRVESSCLAGSNGVETKRFEKELQLQSSFGSVQTIRLTSGPLRMAGKYYSLIVLNDISKFKSEAERISTLEEKLERATAELDQFAYVASHDLKAPLRVIDNTSQWLVEDLTPHLTDDTRETLAMLRGRVQRMERLLNALLEHSRVGREVTNVEPTSGRIIASSLVSLFEKHSSFEVNFNDQFLQARIPREPLSTIFGHLIDNGIRHHHLSSGKIHVSLEIEGAIMVFRVLDDGPGIPEQYHQKVFQVFQTLTRRDEFDSNGMGLAIAQKHAQIHGGRIAVEGNRQQGTCIRLDWPLPQLSELEREMAS